MTITKHHILTEINKIITISSCIDIDITNRLINNIVDLHKLYKQINDATSIV